MPAPLMHANPHCSCQPSSIRLIRSKLTPTVRAPQSGRSPKGLIRLARNQLAISNRRNRHTHAQQLLPYRFIRSGQAQPAASGELVQVRLQVLHSQGYILILQLFPCLSNHFPQGQIQPIGQRKRLYRRCTNLHMFGDERSEFAAVSPLSISSFLRQ